MRLGAAPAVVRDHGQRRSGLGNPHGFGCSPLCLVKFRVGSIPHFILCLPMAWLARRAVGEEFRVFAGSVQSREAAGGYGPAGSMVTVQLVWREMQVAMDWP